MTNHHLPLSLSCALVLLGAVSLQASLHQSAPTPRAAAGDLLVAPTRIVFEGTKRTAEVNLLNIGDKPALYRISLVHERMTEDGKLQDIETPGPGEKFADDLIRFTPRQVLLDPHVAQVIRIQMRLPANLDAGEYRSHMLFRAVTAPTPETTLPTAAQPPKGLSVQITPIYGLSIPIIVRHGVTTSTAEISELRLTSTPEGMPVLLGTMTRSGNASVYGDLYVEFAAKGKPFHLVTRANGLAVYTPNAVRRFALLLSKDKTLDLHNGEIRVTFRGPESDGAQSLAKTNLATP